jgi:eukaryotic-like serine/threonine-protein kinase
MTDSQQRYRVVEKLESGGMAEVFRAESEGLQGFRKQVAIKRVLPHLSSKKKFISMFLDEARLSAHLSHSNCVQVFDIGVGDNAFFIVMEFVDGANLKTIIEHLKKNGRDFPVECAVYIALETCKGLAYAHELTDPNGGQLHIVHRDVSPPNILITKFGEVKIVDFGLAKANSQLEKSEPGIIKGKFSYLSPEAAMGQEVDSRTDIFAVGIILWELLAGQRLFLGDTDFQTVKRVQAASVPSISGINKRVPLELERIINKALARDPNTRYQAARDLGVDLARFMFKYAVTVSTFDIANLVQGAMKERQRFRPQQASIIDKLIEEALLEFTSLTEQGGGAKDGGAKPITVTDGGKIGSASIPAAAPQAGYVDIGSWIDEMAPAPGSNPDDALRASFPPGLAEGNLSVLEDDAPPSAPPPHVAAALPPVALPPPRAAAGAATPSPPAALQLPLAPAGAQGAALADKRGGPGATIGLLVAVGLFVAAAAAAWFFHIIPH